MPLTDQDMHTNSEVNPPKTKIYFVPLTAYPLLSRRNRNIAGGAKLQQVILARENIYKNGTSPILGLPPTRLKDF